jgi:hypothetical protein
MGNYGRWPGSEKVNFMYSRYPRKKAWIAGFQIFGSNYEEIKMSLCIYHNNCADGFGSAWVVRKALGDINFFGANYQEPPPNVAGEDVIMVDFSYKRPVLLVC